MLDSLCEYFYTSDAFPNTHIRNLKRLDGDWGKFKSGLHTISIDISFCVPEISMTHDYIVSDGTPRMNILPSRQPGKVMGSFITDSDASYRRHYVNEGSFISTGDTKLAKAWLSERGSSWGGSRWNS